MPEATALLITAQSEYISFAVALQLDCPGVSQFTSCKRKPLTQPLALSAYILGGGSCCPFPLLLWEVVHTRLTCVGAAWHLALLAPRDLRSLDERRCGALKVLTQRFTAVYTSSVRGELCLCAELKVHCACSNSGRAAYAILSALQ